MAERGQLGVEPLLAGQGEEGDPAIPAGARRGARSRRRSTACPPRTRTISARQPSSVSSTNRSSAPVPQQVVRIPGADGGEPVGQPADGGGEGLDLGVGGREESDHAAWPLDDRRRRSGRGGREKTAGESGAHRPRIGRPGPLVASPSKAPRARGRTDGPAVSASRSGLLARGPSASSAFPRGMRPGQWPDPKGSNRRGEGPFPLTAAGPRRIRTGFPTTGTRSKVLRFPEKNGPMTSALSWGRPVARVNGRSRGKSPRFRLSAPARLRTIGPGPPPDPIPPEPPGACRRPSLVSLLVLAWPVLSPAQDPKAADGEVLLGQPRADYRRRRHDLMDRIVKAEADRALPGPTPRGEMVVVLRGEDDRGKEDFEEGRFRQRNDFAYLTGVDVPGAGSSSSRSRGGRPSTFRPEPPRRPSAATPPTPCRGRTRPSGSDSTPPSRPRSSWATSSPRSPTRCEGRANRPSTPSRRRRKRRTRGPMRGSPGSFARGPRGPHSGTSRRSWARCARSNPPPRLALLQKAIDITGDAQEQVIRSIRPGTL